MLFGFIFPPVFCINCVHDFTSSRYGDIRQLVDSKEVVVDDNNETVSIMGAVCDTSDHKVAVQELKERNWTASERRV